MYREVFVPVDNSQHSHWAVDRAIEICSRADGQITGNLIVNCERTAIDFGGISSSQQSGEIISNTVVGNTEGISKVDDQMTVAPPTEKAPAEAPPEPEAQFYTVASGDSLSKIAKEFYGDPMKYPVIFEANKPMLKDPDKIYPGQVLRIPPQE